MTCGRGALASDRRLGLGVGLKVGGFGAGRDDGKNILHVRNEQKQGARKVLDVFGEQ